MSLSRVCSVQPPWRRQQSDIVGHSTGTRHCCPCTDRDVSAWLCSLSLVLPFPLLPCPDVLDLLAGISIFLANGIIDILIVVLMFLLPCAFGDLSITSGILPHPLSITAAAQLLGELPMAPSFLHQAAGNSVLLTPPFPLSCTVTVLSLCCHSQGCCFLYRCLLILPGCEQPFLLYTWELRIWQLYLFDVQISLGKRVSKGFAGKTLMICSISVLYLFYIYISPLPPLPPLSWLFYHFQCRQLHSFWLL